RRCRIRRRQRGGGRDHARTRRCRADDHCDAAREHAARRPRARGGDGGGVKLSRLRLGGLIVVVGCGCVIVSLALNWYEAPEGNLSAWATFGPAVVLLMLAALAGLALVLATVTERSTAIPVAAAVWSTLFGFFGVVAAVVRLLERPHHASALCA